MPHGKVTKTQVNTTNESQEVSPFPAGDAKECLTKDINNTYDPQKKYLLGTVSKKILLGGLNRYHGAYLALSSDDDQNT